MRTRVACWTKTASGDEKGDLCVSQFPSVFFSWGCVFVSALSLLSKVLDLNAQCALAVDRVESVVLGISTRTAPGDVGGLGFDGWGGERANHLADGLTEEL